MKSPKINKVYKELKSNEWLYLTTPDFTNEFENIPNQEDQESGSLNDQTPTGTTLNEIRITIRNLQGEEKELIIKYNE